MRWISTSIAAMEGLSPLGLMVVGGALALTLAPSAKKAARRAAVLTARGVLGVTGATTNVLSKVRDGIEDVVEEARYQQEYAKLEQMENGVVHMADKAREAKTKASEEFTDMVKGTKEEEK